MTEIGQLNKTSNLWPVSSNRAIEKSGQHKKSSKKNLQDEQKQNKRSEDETGQNVDEYA